MNRFIQSIVDRIRRSGSEEEHDWFDSDPEPPHLARSESRLAEDRVGEKKQRKRIQHKTIDNLPVLGATYDRVLSEEGETSKLSGFVLIYDGVPYQVPFEDVLSPFLYAPKGISYSQIKGDGSRFGYEGMMINYLRQVLHIHDPKDPLLSTLFRNLDAPIKLPCPSGRSTRHYVPLSDADCGLIVGMLSSCFKQMRGGRWF